VSCDDPADRYTGGSLSIPHDGDGNAGDDANGRAIGGAHVTLPGSAAR
jgi:hypothetical protein